MTSTLVTSRYLSCHQDQTLSRAQSSCDLCIDVMIPQAEQISVEHVSKATPLSAGDSTIDKQAKTMHTTLQALNKRYR